MFEKELGIIGIGKIGSALLKRFICTNTVKNDSIIIYDIDGSRSKDLSEELKVEIASDNLELVK